MRRCAPSWRVFPCLHAYFTALLHGIASVALVAMMLIVVGDVVLRAVFNTPLRGAYDLVSIALLVMVFFGIGPVVVMKREILIDLIDGAVKPIVLRALKTLPSVLTLAVFSFVGWAMLEPAINAWRWGDRSLELGLPLWLLWLPAFVGLVGILISAGLALQNTLNGRDS